MYNNPTPVAVALIPVLSAWPYPGKQGLLAGRRTIAPKIGEFAFPGGYVDEMESAEQAVSREVQEETGFIIPVDQWITVGTRITPHNKLLIFLLSKTSILHAELEFFKPQPECDALMVVTRDDMLCFDTHNEILQSNLW